VKVKYRNLNFPENLIKNKINEIVERKFVPLNNKEEKLKDIIDILERNCNINDIISCLHLITLNAKK
jgi:hypothetical protein